MNTIKLYIYQIFDWIWQHCCDHPFLAVGIVITLLLIIRLAVRNKMNEERNWSGGVSGYRHSSSSSHSSFGSYGDSSSGDSSGGGSSHCSGGGGDSGGCSSGD